MIIPKTGIMSPRISLKSVESFPESFEENCK